jgi:hypothetical protein
MTETSTETTQPRNRDHRDRELWLRRGCALIVAAVAAYGSYEHQRAFALHGGADPISAALWPLSVDGLLLLATVGLLKSSQQTRRVQLAAWLAFLLGIAVSLAANIAAAPTLAWQPILVAGWPPIALLLAAELLTHYPRPREDPETPPADPTTSDETDEAVVPRAAGHPAEHLMWEHFQREQARGRIPTGAELDRAAGTNNYGRTVLRRWRDQGRIPPTNPNRRNGHRVVPSPSGAPPG